MNIVDLTVNDSMFLVLIGACVLLIFLSVPLFCLCMSASVHFDEKAKFIRNLGREMFPDKYLTTKEWFQKTFKKK